VGLLTGRSPNRAGVYDWIPAAGRPRPNARDQVHMRADEVTIPALLKQAGYATCMAGKWHCNAKFNSADQPQPGDFGFDHWLATQNNASPSHKNPNNFVRNGEPIGEVDAFSCQYVVTEALEWLGNRNDDKPFFVYLPFHEPHEPVASPEALVQQYRDLSRDEDEAHYFANVANVDAAVGRLRAGLRQMDVADNTLIVFSSDNGPETLDRYRGANRSYGTPGPLRGMKLHTTEAGFRVAGIACWPEQIEPGQVRSDVVSALDLLPTFCTLAGAELPATLRLDGTDISPLLQSGETVTRSQPLLWAYYNALNERRVAMRQGNYKVLASLDGGQLPKFTNVTQQTFERIRQAPLSAVQIFDVTEDIHEEHDLSGDDPALTERLTETLREAYRELLSDSHVW
jgi:arylsulfatase A